MAGTPITHFEPDPTRLAILQVCIDSYGVGDDDAEWPNNIISRQAVVYGNGVIARRGVPVRHAVDPDELALCQRLADEAAALMSGVPVGMGSESGDTFQGFFIAANVDETTPRTIDERLIRTRFGGTIFPFANITVEPLAETEQWWNEVEVDGAESGEDYFRPWLAMIRWFQNQADFIDARFVRIGDGKGLDELELSEEELPEGTELMGCVLPRLALGLTRRGSLVGLFGVSVQT